MIVTIDGPAGSGKSTAARALAERLGFEFLDTGAMYRAVALVLHRQKIDFADEERVRHFLQSVRFDMPPGRVLINGEDVSHAIRTPEIASASSKIAAYAPVRRFLVEQQRAIARGKSMVCEGRDQGTVVFPDARWKFFMTASPTARAERRYLDMLGRGQKVSLEQVILEQEERDRRDSTRDADPLRPAADAITIDTSSMTADEVLNRLEEEVRQCLRG
jgi:cytidylate kinase